MKALAFSGGKDSLACWYLYRHKKPFVLWVNTGKNYPETLSIIDEVKRESNFIEIKSDQSKQIEENGLPSDIVPIENTVHGMLISGPRETKVQSYLQCCFENIARPILDKCKSLGVTHLIRGQRLNESFKSTSVDGDMIEGITFLQPIENWTKQQVLDFILKERGSIPEHYAIEHSSLDCYDCTAFMSHSKDRIEWTRVKHPHLYEKYKENLWKLKDACFHTMKDLQDA